MQLFIFSQWTRINVFTRLRWHLSVIEHQIGWWRSPFYRIHKLLAALKAPYIKVSSFRRKHCSRFDILPSCFTLSIRQHSSFSFEFKQRKRISYRFQVWMSTYCGRRRRWSNDFSECRGSYWWRVLKIHSYVAFIQGICSHITVLLTTVGTLLK